MADSKGANADHSINAGHDDNGPVRVKHLFGRRKGPRLSARRQHLMAELLPRLRVNTDHPPASLDPASLFGPANIRNVWLEVGFGGGEHLAWQAERNPGIGMIGCEPFINGVASLLARIDDGGLNNIRIVDDDAMPLIRALAAESIGRIFILHPDPWPKRRHWKRRFISHANLDEMARILKPGGELRLASDIPHYIGWTLKHMARRDDFRWLARSPQDWRQRPADWPPTRYGLKAEREGRPPIHLRFVRTSG